jgi:uncharacterized protein with HEPN domain
LPFRDNDTHLRDILVGIDYIEAFLGDMEFAAYHADIKTRSAVERQMQIITEASNRLGEDAEKLCPVIDWNGFVVCEISSDMAITRSMTRSFGTRSRMNYRLCARRS